MLKKYNPKKIVGGWFNIPFQGYMDGTFVDVEYAEDAVTPHVGSQGDITLVLNPNRMAKATITLVQGSPTNRQLAIQTPDARRNFMPTGVFSLVDLNGETVVQAKDGVIQKTAKVEFGKTITGRQWVFILPEAEINPGAGGD